MSAAITTAMTMAPSTIATIRRVVSGLTPVSLKVILVATGRSAARTVDHAT